VEPWRAADFGPHRVRRAWQGIYVEIPRSDQMVFSGEALAVTVGQIDDWIARNHVLAIA
jgi:hypothetical protein